MDSLIDALTNLESRTRLPRETLEQIFSMAMGFMNARQFERAYRYYSLLTLYDPVDPRFLAGQALCARELGRTPEALLLLDLATIINPEHPVPVLLASECLIELGRIQEAKEYLSIITCLCAEKAEYQAVAERATGLLNLLEAKTAPAEF